MSSLDIRPVVRIEFSNRTLQSRFLEPESGELKLYGDTGPNRGPSRFFFFFFLISLLNNIPNA